MARANTNPNRRNFLMSSASAAVIPAAIVSSPSIAAAAAHEPPRRRGAGGSFAICAAYNEWLERERRMLAHEMYPELEGPDRLTPLNTGACLIYENERGSPSERAGRMLELLGADLKAIEAFSMHPGEIQRDLIFDAIENHRRAYAEFDEACSALSAAQDRLLEQTGQLYPTTAEGKALEARLVKPADLVVESTSSAVNDICLELALTPPSTLKGLAAVLAYWREVDDLGFHLFGGDYHMETFRSTLEQAICSLAGLPRPPAPKVLTEDEDDETFAEGITAEQVDEAHRLGLEPIRDADGCIIGFGQAS